MCAGGGSGLCPPRTPRAGVHDACVSCQAARRSELGCSLSIGLCRHKASEPLYKAGGHPQGLDRCEAHKVCSTRALGSLHRRTVADLAEASFAQFEPSGPGQPLHHQQHRDDPRVERHPAAEMVRRRPEKDALHVRATDEELPRELDASHMPPAWQGTPQFRRP